MLSTRFCRAAGLEVKLPSRGLESKLDGEESHREVFRKGFALLALFHLRKSLAKRDTRTVVFVRALSDTIEMWKYSSMGRVGNAGVCDSAVVADNVVLRVVVVLIGQKYLPMGWRRPSKMSFRSLGFCLILAFCVTKREENHLLGLTSYLAHQMFLWAVSCRNRALVSAFVPCFVSGVPFFAEVLTYEADNAAGPQEAVVLILNFNVVSSGTLQREVGRMLRPPS
ncbi:hypothetical protein IV203_029608 [Nitzschia inconspicua]|uniref:Uncharacterized protein n=1 Tax=Nitzschia inconspicua TaxID=303405 RepID=A0A9K3LR13_9STRA|nr:hypothetical protein IV203_029608 [Nitzschia inconspicua]